MHAKPTIALLAAALAAPLCNAQDNATVIYEFEMVLTQNQLIDRGIPSRFDALTSGTPGLLRMEVAQQESVYPGFSGENFKYFSVLSLDFTSGILETSGSPGVYPSSQFTTDMHVANDSILSGPTNTFHDFFGNVIALSAPDIGFSLLVMSDQVTNGFSDVFDDAQLPTGEQLTQISSRSYYFQTSYDPSARVTYTITNVTSTFIPTPASAGILALAALTTTRRRR